MDNYKTSKIQKFLEDKGMVIAVYEAVRDIFLDDKKYNNEVEILAARMIAITLLNKAWDELERFKSSKDDNEQVLKQVGL